WPTHPPAGAYHSSQPLLQDHRSPAAVTLNRTSRPVFAAQPDASSRLRSPEAGPHSRCNQRGGRARRLIALLLFPKSAPPQHDTEKSDHQSVTSSRTNRKRNDRPRNHRRNSCPVTELQHAAGTVCSLNPNQG